jgi:phenylalanyl-tRNA synthetase alpha subunit
MKNKELGELIAKIAKLEKEKLKKERSISTEMDSLKREKIASATVEMATELQKLKNERMQKEQEEKERLEKERPLLEKKFNALVKEKTAEIEMHLENARKEVEKAQAISDKSGVPFKSKIVIDFGRECYIPKSIEKLKEEFGCDEDEGEGIVYDFLQDFYLPNGESYGWASDGWSSSSLTC